MARLHEYQGKAILAANGFKIPRGVSPTPPSRAIRVWIDTAKWPQIRRAIETHSGGLISDRDGGPATALTSEEFANKDSELLACDVECRLAGIEGFHLEPDIPGLDELIGRKAGS